MKHPTQMSSGDPAFQPTEEESLRPYYMPLPQPLVCCWDHSGPSQFPFLKNLPTVGRVRIRDLSVLLLK